MPLRRAEKHERKQYAPGATSAMSIRTHMRAFDCSHAPRPHTFVDVDQEEDERPNIIISYAAFAKLHATEFPHLLPGSKRLCPVCEDLKFHQGHLLAEQHTEELRVFQQHKSAIEQERAFEAALRSEARQSLDKVRECARARHTHRVCVHYQPAIRLTTRDMNHRRSGGVECGLLGGRLHEPLWNSVLFIWNAPSARDTSLYRRRRKYRWRLVVKNVCCSRSQ